MSASSGHGGGFETSVDQALGLDMAMGGPRARGYLSARRAARWLLDVHEWEDIERVAAEAVGLYKIPHGIDLQAAGRMLGQERIKGRTGLALISISDSSDDKRLNHKLIGLLCDAEPFVMLFDPGRTWYLTDDLAIPAVLEATEPGQVDVHPSLAEIELYSPRNGDSMGDAGRMALDLLRDSGIRIIRSEYPGPTVRLYLPATQAPLAVALIDALARRITDMAAESPT